MRVLISGGGGFPGAHLCDAMLAEGHSVVCVDNLLTGRMESLSHLAREPRFEFFRQDCCNSLDPGKIDYVSHFASLASLIDYPKHGIETLRVGSVGTLNCLEIAKKYSSKFLLPSTSECYGDPLEHPQQESYWGQVNSIGPGSVYDQAKRFAEAATMAYQRHHQVDTRIVRIFNTYGPRLQIDDGRVISNFRKHALCEEDLTVYGAGLQTRSVCHLSDEIAGIVALSRSGEHFPVNIGNPNELTMLGCARIVLEVTRSASQIRVEPLPQDVAGSASPTLCRPGSCSAGSPRSTSPLDCGCRWTMSGRRCRRARRRLRSNQRRRAVEFRRTHVT